MSDLQFDRVASVNVGGLLVDGLDLTFKVSKSLKPEPNTCELAIWGLSETSRQRLETMGPVPVQIEAGYRDATSVIFLGTLRSVRTVFEGPEVITAIASGDGETAYKTARAAISVGRETKSEEVLLLLARSLGVKDGNLADAVRSLRAAGVADRYAEGAVFAGQASRELTQVTRSLGLTWSIQDGALQFLEQGAALAGQAIRLTPSSGLIGSPTVATDGTLSGRMLLQRDVMPGRLLVLESRVLSGQFRIEKTTHTGSLSEGDWYVDFEAKRY